ncbi:MAG: D-alanyl-D-alanine carboxypeptidase [Clostridia bacterium]|nr:D-alanyl-D-alanine carboxypeptidase [Clostridia bacterium]
MKKTFVLIMLFCAVMLCSIPACALDTSARSAVLIDAASKTVLYEKEPDVRLPMASTTKIMTALVALENADTETVVTIPPEAVGVEGSSVCLKAGESMTLGELLYAVLLESANDAAAAVAYAIGGSIEDFAIMMNEKATSMGLENTSFANPHGLDAENHYTTAKELAIIAAEALENESFKEIVGTYRYKIPMSAGGYRYLLNHNKMLKLYDGAIGVKTGFTKKSGRCLVSAAERDGLRLVSVTLNAPDDWRDHRAMLDYGFDTYEMKTLAREGEYSFTLDCIGKKITQVKAVNKGGVSLCLAKQGGEITQTVYLPRFVYAPVNEGDRLGYIEFARDGKVIASVELFASIQ